MKTEKFAVWLANPLFTYGAAPISDGPFYVFIISTVGLQAYQDCSILLLHSDDSLYLLSLTPPANEVSLQPGIVNPISISHDLKNTQNTNVVVKIITQGGTRSTYVNDIYVGAYTPRSSAPVKQALLRGQLPYNNTQYAHLGMTAVVFDATERNIVDGFATAMMNPEKTYFTTWQSTSPVIQQAQNDLADREKAVEAKEAEVKKREDEVKAKEDASDKGLRQGSGTNSGIGIHPPDADSIKLSSTVAWPRAVQHVLGRSSLLATQKKHDELMADWVIARGDNISSNAYDYFVYSQFVAWPKAAKLENATDADLTKIWERHAEIMKVL